jgi:hypothetical protein
MRLWRRASRLVLSDCPHADDRDMAGRYVHMFSSKEGFEGAIAGMGAYLHGDGTYTVALQVGTAQPTLCS